MNIKTMLFYSLICILYSAQAMNPYMGKSMPELQAALKRANAAQMKQIREAMAAGPGAVPAPQPMPQPQPAAPQQAQQNLQAIKAQVKATWQQVVKAAKDAGHAQDARDLAQELVQAAA